MDPIIIDPTDHSPCINFDPSGKLLMEGRSIPEDVNKLFTPLIDFASNLKAKNVVFDINLEYFNTATSKRLLDLVKHLDANSKIESLLVNWHYEIDDEDSHETAEIYEECLLRANFRYCEHSEMVTLAGAKV
jgi:hypothetical protein